MEAGAKEDAASMRENRIVRWYILQAPSWTKRTESDLKSINQRSIRAGMSGFEFFAPTFVAVKHARGKITKETKPLLLNYVLVRSSEAEIVSMMMKMGMSKYNFLPRVTSEKRQYFPYLTEKAVDDLRWLALSYENNIPIMAPKPGMLKKGDRIRIVSGPFAGREATVFSSPGTKRRKVMVRIDDWALVPLLEVKEGDYELLELNTESHHQYSVLSDNAVMGEINDILACSIAGADLAAEGNGSTVEKVKKGATAEELQSGKARAEKIFREYKSLEVDTDIMRSKKYSVLLMAATVIGDEAEKASALETIVAFLPAVSAETTLALMLVTLYACTDSRIWFERADAALRPWRSEKKPKPAKKTLLNRFDLYATLYGRK